MSNKLTCKELKDIDPKKLNYAELTQVIKENENANLALAILAFLVLAGIMTWGWHPDFIYSKGYWIKFLVWSPAILSFIIFVIKIERMRKFEDEKDFRENEAVRSAHSKTPKLDSLSE